MAEKFMKLALNNNHQITQSDLYYNHF